MNKKHPISIGIPTYEASDSLLITLGSIYSQTAFEKVKQIIVAVDGKRLNSAMRRKLTHTKVKIVEFKKRVGQAGRINDLLKLCSTQYLILTNDDVVLSRDAVAQMLKTLTTSKADLVAGRVEPITGGAWPKIFHIGYQIQDKLMKQWSHADNYLACNGRLLGLNMGTAKSLHLPINSWNNDAFIYLFAKLHDWKFIYSSKARCFYQPPANLKDHSRQSNKFNNSMQENQVFFSQPLISFYKYPKILLLKSIWEVFRSQPFNTTLYLIILCWLRINSYFRRWNAPKAGFWETDFSTKKLKLIKI